MKRLKLLTLAGIAATAIAAIATSTASGVISLDPLPASVELPLLFQFESTEGFTFESAAGHVITCGTLKGSGEFTGETGLAELKFAGCLEPSIGIKCMGLSDKTAGEILFKAESIYLRHLLSKENVPEEVSLLIRLGVVHFQCSILLYVLEGCVSSMDLLTANNGEGILGLLRESVFASFLQAGSVQKPVSVDQKGSMGMEECFMTVKEGNGAAERVGLSGAATISKFKHGAVNVTVLVDLLK